jgi:hypothetical protein
MNPRLDPRKWLSFLLSPLDGPLMLLILASPPTRR